ncbi:hypothetical protein HanIR_Chr03g0144321 [Helianthus annuus]|nr:hypothetical protein HanIR_Chr03g0144321 [Helianthus annuus]
MAITGPPRVALFWTLLITQKKSLALNITKLFTIFKSRLHLSRLLSHVSFLGPFIELIYR